ncbi:MAG: glycosyltransferase family 2 protein [Acidobacteriota bacterium]
MPKLESVAVAIVSWNGRQHLETCLPALAKQRDPGVPWRVMVLDNGSSDGTVEWLRREHPRVEVVASEVNLGFCSANNRLVEESDADAVIFLNNDTRPQEDWLAALVDEFRAAPEDVAAVSGMIVDWEGERLDFAKGVMTFDGHAFQLDFRRPLDQVKLPAAGSELPFGCGGNVLVRRDSYLQAGGFDPAYFAYLEDVDLGWRLWSGGERVLFTPQAVVHHRSSATSDLLGLYNRGFLFERNAFLTAYKNFDDELWPQVLPTILLTLNHRVQELLEKNNPGGALLALDPYAGHIANTASGAAASALDPTLHRSRLDRWRSYGPRELVGRLLLRLARWAWPGAPSPADPVLRDERTVAQLRAHSFLLRHLDQAAADRHAVQQRRKRPDQDYFQRFPAYVVPTYPGDQKLFGSSGFRSWLAPDLPIVEATLGEIMSLE